MKFTTKRKIFLAGDNRVVKSFCIFPCKLSSYTYRQNESLYFIKKYIWLGYIYKYQRFGTDGKWLTYISEEISPREKVSNLLERYKIERNDDVLRLLEFTLPFLDECQYKSELIWQLKQIKDDYTEKTKSPKLL